MEDDLIKYYLELMERALRIFEAAELLVRKLNDLVLKTLLDVFWWMGVSHVSFYR